MFTIEIEGLEPLVLKFQEAAERLPANIQEILEETAEDTVEKAKILASERLEKPGTYLDSFYISPAPLEVRFGNIHRAARFLEYGTQPHIIEPRTRKALRFEVDGTMIFARRVLHPGTEPCRILSDALAEELVVMREKLREAAKI